MQYLKRILKSRTVWVNILGAAAFIIQSHQGFVLAPEVEGGALAIINFLLRLDTSKPISEK